ncbi:phosphatase domain-containing putative toxin [Primorskyibacter sedentarius]|uniref:Tyrosine phosphatase family protein n=1 Tax=Primorskyibacter sedentarius TaxID=745311 RepID=A0A4R3JA53_9RHOB|nr:tyrosine-protein phosphatase [Primorskyibacter sedentarius]TCS61863.1 tyrosine phosphatase family protein [Primorskyibacter sedentarius]
MLKRLWTRIEEAERSLRRSFGKDIVTPSGRRWATFHYNIFDHAFLRSFWTNFFEVAPGVYRSNQPTHRRFEKYAEMGIKTVINLRGTDKHAHYLFEQESCEALGLTLINAKLWARQAAKRENIVHLIDVMRSAEKPLMFHCKSGADRAGFASALYLLVFENAPVELARRQMGLKYIHLEFTKTGIQGYILDSYAARNAREPIGFEEWIRTEYDHRALQRGFDAKTPPNELVLT